MFVSFNNSSNVIGISYNSLVEVIVASMLGEKPQVRVVRPRNLSSMYLLDKAWDEAVHTVVCIKRAKRK